jgi:hypothetical protein
MKNLQTRASLNVLRKAMVRTMILKNGASSKCRFSRILSLTICLLIAVSGFIRGQSWEDIKFLYQLGVAGYQYYRSQETFFDAENYRNARVFDALSVYREYQKNEVRAKQNYYMHYIALRGPVGKIRSDGNAVVVDLHDGSEFLPISVAKCRFIDGGSKNRAVALENNSVAIIVGVCTSDKAGDVVLQDCEIYGYGVAERARVLNAQLQAARERAQAENERRAKENEARQAAAQKAREQEQWLKGIIASAEQYEKREEYETAILQYRKALGIFPAQDAVINDHIKKAQEALASKNERETMIYDYQELKPAEYKTLNDKLTNQLKELLFLKEVEGYGKIILSKTIKYNSETYSNVSSTFKDKTLESRLRSILNNAKMQSAWKGGRTVSVKAEFPFEVRSEFSVVDVTKKHSDLYFDKKTDKSYQAEVSRLLKEAPSGEFSWDINRLTINKEDYFDSRMLKYKAGGGGPGYAFLSLLVPGWGDRFVSNNKNHATRITLLTYGLIGLGVGCKFYSNYEYKQYHAATTQEATDIHYKRANFANQAFYGLVAVGGIFWITDIITVWKKGTKNIREQKAFQQSHLGIYSEPSSKSTGLSYALDF